MAKAGTYKGEFLRWLDKDLEHRSHVRVGPGDTLAGVADAVKKQIASLQEEGIGHAVAASGLKPEWAMEICDDLGHGLEWAVMCNKNGQQTGLALLVYNLDPTSPHQHTESNLSDHLRSAFEHRIGQGFRVKDARGKRRVIEEETTRGRQEDVQLYAVGQDLAEYAYSVVAQVAFKNEDYKAHVEECFHSVHGTASTKLAIGLRVHTISLGGKYSPLQWFIFGISWWEEEQRCIFHGGKFFGDQSNCTAAGMPPYQVQVRCRPLVEHTPLQAHGASMGNLDLHNLGEEIQNEVISLKKGNARPAAICWREDCKRETLQAIASMGLERQSQIAEERQDEMLCLIDSDL